MNNRTYWARKNNPGMPQIIPIEELMGHGGPPPFMPPMGMMGRSSNHIYFYSDVDPDSIMNLSLQLKDLELEHLRKAVEDERPPAPIHLHVNSGGGDLDSGIAAFETIRTCRVPVHTYVEGLSASAATLIHLAGSVRYVGAYSNILIHQFTKGFWGTFENQKDDMANSELQMGNLMKIYGTKTKLNKRQLEALLKRDLLCDAQTSIKYGLADKIL